MRGHRRRARKRFYFIFLNLTAHRFVIKDPGIHLSQQGEILGRLGELLGCLSVAVCKQNHHMSFYNASDNNVKTKLKLSASVLRAFVHRCANSPIPVITGLSKSNRLLLHAVQAGWRLQPGFGGIFLFIAVVVFSCGS